MTKDGLRTLRLSETIAPFGVGAIVDIAGDSLMATDISWWPKNSPRLSCDRLERELRGRTLKSPPSVPSYPSKNTPGLTFQRFPSWLFCQNCRSLRQLNSSEETGKAPRCVKCAGPRVPMRFIALCEKGSHVQDISWRWWAHRAATVLPQQKCADGENLFFRTSENGNEGLSGLSVECKSCGVRRNFGELSAKGALKGDGVKCSGKQPWQSKLEAVDCDATVQVVQRGATNVHMADVISAIDIPEAKPLSLVHAESIRNHGSFGALSSDPDGPISEYLRDLIARELGLTAETVQAVALSNDSITDGNLAAARSGLLDGEWAAFQTPLTERSAASPNFITETAGFVRQTDAPVLHILGDLIASVVLVRRLREVRAMTGFRRYSPDSSVIPVSFAPKGTEQWYPAMESFGEGIFFSLCEAAVSEWESAQPVQERTAVLERRRLDSHIASRHSEVTPRSVMLHTVAHLLMRRLAFNSGYASAALRERVYSSVEGADRQAGILIYTASGDSEGTLGGLVRQGEPPRLARMLLAAIEDSDWCSNDPVCRESKGQGMNALNLAACHGCALAPETSCESSNLFLDRSLVVGADGAGNGFFDSVLAAGRSAS